VAISEPSLSVAAPPSRNPAPTPKAAPSTPPPAGAPVADVIAWVEAGTPADPAGFHTATREGAPTDLGTDIAFTTATGYQRVEPGLRTLRVQPAGGQPISVQASVTAGSIYSLLVLQTADGRLTAAVLADAKREGPVPQGGVNTGAGGSVRDTRPGPIVALFGLLLVTVGGLAAASARRRQLRPR